MSSDEYPLDELVENFVLNATRNFAIIASDMEINENRVMLNIEDKESIRRSLSDLLDKIRGLDSGTIDIRGLVEPTSKYILKTVAENEENLMLAYAKKQMENNTQDLKYKITLDINTSYLNGIVQTISLLASIITMLRIASSESLHDALGKKFNDPLIKNLLRASFFASITASLLLYLDEKIEEELKTLDNLIAKHSNRYKSLLEKFSDGNIDLYNLVSNLSSNEYQTLLEIIKRMTFINSLYHYIREPISKIDVNRPYETNDAIRYMITNLGYIYFTVKYGKPTITKDFAEMIAKMAVKAALEEQKREEDNKNKNVSGFGLQYYGSSIN
ncbi:MAG: hypothetical protein ACP5G1_02965 [Nanopusillaceae archaeon]